MLKRIYIKNFAVIDSLDIDFCKNLNVLSGETGAGKSIIIESVNFLFGRAKGTDILRTGENEGFVSAVFDLDGPESNENLISFFKETGIDYETGEDIIIKRDISLSGKSRFFINNEAVNKNVILRLSENLVSIFGQNDKMFLTSPESQLAFIDEFAENLDFLSEIKNIYGKIRTLNNERESIKKMIGESSRIKTLNSYIISDVEALGVNSPDDESCLKEELKRLENINSIKDYILSSIDLIDSEDFGILKNINLLISGLQKLCAVDSNFAKTKELDNAENAKILIEDILVVLQKYEGFEFDEDRLAEIKSKIDKIIGIENKYGVSDLGDLIALYDRAKNEFESEIELEEKLAGVIRNIARLEEEFKAIALKLHKRRIDSALILEKKIESELLSLKIKPVFKIDIKLHDFGVEFFDTGLDSCIFMFSANPGENPKPLSNVASGGELSRLSLCILKVIYSGAENNMRHNASGLSISGGITFIFDEIDSGIGGDVANYVGEALKSLAAVNQVILITHLAQVASFADKHFFVYKEVKSGKTYTGIKELSMEDRVYEIARMLSGDTESEASLSHAREILKKRGATV